MVVKIRCEDAGGVDLRISKFICKSMGKSYAKLKRNVMVWGLITIIGKIKLIFIEGG